MMPDIKNTTIVFDLDDTLYLEADYVVSGKVALGKELNILCGVDVTEDMIQCQGDFLALACSRLGLPIAAKKSLLWAYRLHHPTLELRAGMADLLSTLAQRQIQLCILTDGRSITQRLKVQALGLLHLPIYISEEIGEEKPSQKGYRMIERDFPAKKFVYVGDNCAKDFFAPNEMGWSTCFVDPGSAGVHRASTDSELETNYLPRLRARNVDELRTLLLGS